MFSSKLDMVVIDFNPSTGVAKVGRSLFRPSLLGRVSYRTTRATQKETLSQKTKNVRFLLKT